MFVDRNRAAAFALSAGRAVDGCRRLESRVQDDGKMIARLLGGMAGRHSDDRQNADEASAALRATYLAHTQELFASAQALRQAVEELIAIAAVDNAAPAAIGRPRVLVVEDHDDTRDLMASALRIADLHVITAANGLEGLLAAHSCWPAVIVMDMQMPILTGLEATRLLKATPHTRPVPVIAHTARPEQCRKYVSELFAHVLPKPTNPDVLLALVRRFLPATESRVGANS